MAKSKRFNGKEAARCFSESFQNAGVTLQKPNITKGWAAFKVFCMLPIERTTEGFIFHTGYKLTFPPPDHERVLDYTAYEIAFTRYWYEKGKASDTAYVAECSFKVADHTVLRNHESVDIEIDAGEGDEAQRQMRFEKFVKNVEAITDLWEVLSTAKPIVMESYCGPQ